ncbi:MAG: winged helix-turn-helix domain-containing protein [Sphaerochaetaceae bacterium]|nr:winged helix-turn-helix domain-containing protein [Sphaerochaetaceae bacterium]
MILEKNSFELIGKRSKISLRNHEYQIIETLMTNSDMYFSVDKLFEKVWGYDSDTDISVVWVDISNLRKKLSQSGSNVTIKGKRNLVYRLEEK